VPAVGTIITRIGTEVAAASVGGVTVGKARVTADSRAMGDILVEIASSDGVLVELFVSPDLEPARQPSANWDLTVRDAAGRVAYSGASMSNSSDTRVRLNFPVQGSVFVNATNLGDGKRIEVIAFFHTGPIVDIPQDASDVEYVPGDATDWTGSVDPGNVDDALDQLAQRETDHAADTTDPHGAAMTVSTKVITPKVENTSPFLNIDVIDASTSTVTIDNSGAGVCDLTTSGKITTGADKAVIAGNGANSITIDPAAGTITPAGTASPLTIADLVLPHLGILPGTGNYYLGQHVGPQVGSSSSALDKLYCMPFTIGRRITIDALAISVVTQAGQKVRLGVYDSIAATGLPGNLLAEATELTTSTNNTLEVQTITPDLTLDPGLYYTAMLVDANSLTTAASYIFGCLMMATPLSSYILSYAGYGERSYTYAALPSSWGTPTYTVGAIYVPRIAMREA